MPKSFSSSPDLLILDEPTNHLDIAATEWLEGFLKNYEGAVLLVSHDRYFLDAVTDTIADIENQKLTVYKGNYSHFRRQKEERQLRQQEMFDQQQAEIARLEAVIKKNMGGDSVQSKLRSRMETRIERMDKVERVQTDTRTVRALFDADAAGRIGRDVLRAESLTKTYGDRTLFGNLNFLIERGDRVGLVGPNGAGKTTLVKLILGTEQPTRGGVSLGHNARVSYFSQHAADSLCPQLSVIDSVQPVGDMTETEARNYLARFLFTGDDVFKSVGMLSGGEKNKLALARMILEPCNLLILDEPTNHLDIASCDALTDMLSKYEGTLLFGGGGVGRGGGVHGRGGGLLGRGLAGRTLARGGRVGGSGTGRSLGGRDGVRLDHSRGGRRGAGGGRRLAGGALARRGRRRRVGGGFVVVVEHVLGSLRFGPPGAPTPSWNAAAQRGGCGGWYCGRGRNTVRKVFIETMVVPAGTAGAAEGLRRRRGRGSVGLQRVTDRTVVVEWSLRQADRYGRTGRGETSDVAQCDH